MFRACLLCALLLVGLLSVGITAQPAGGPPLRLEQLEDKLYVLHGGCMCGNTLFYIADGGVVMVDTKVAGQGDAILGELRAVTDLPIVMIINTHTHFDHTGSNAEFGTIERMVAHENARASLTKTSCPPAGRANLGLNSRARVSPCHGLSDGHSRRGPRAQIEHGRGRPLG